jgi:periplasmic protein TonB
MRTWTLVVSVFAHAAVVAAILVAPIFATADLPDPRRPLTFEALIPIETPVIPVTPPSQPVQPSTITQSIPLTPPTELPPVDAPPIEPPLPVIGACDACGVVGVPIGDGTVGHDVAAPPPPMPARKDPVPVGGVIRPPTRVVYVEPVYPQIALAARVQGTVILQAVIDEQGSVRELRVLRGHPLLDAAAMQAVAKWQFTPTLLNGTTVPVVMTVTVTFALQK